MILFKTSNIEDEWWNGELDWRVKRVVGFVHWWCMKFFPLVKDIVLTEIFRDDDTQETLYNKKVSFNPHGDWRAVDVRSFDMLDNGYDPMQLEEAVNKEFREKYQVPGYKVMLFHKINGGVYHCHIQVKKPRQTKRS